MKTAERGAISPLQGTLARLGGLLLLLLCVLGAGLASAQPDPRQANLRLAPGTAPKSLDGAGTASAGKTLGAWGWKLDAPARMLLSLDGVAGKRSLSVLQPDAAPLAVATSRRGELLVDLFVKLQDPGQAAALDRYGQRMMQAGDVVTLRAPAAMLRPLAEDPAVRFVEASRRSRLFNDNGRVDIRADQVHQGLDLPRAMQGEGVVVGVLDTGIDFTHPDFFDESGGSRIRFLWDMGDLNNTRPPTSVDPQYNWGSEYTKADIDGNPNGVGERDGDGGGGHGTHVAGTAAGGGRFDARLRGIAPKSDIIFVKGIRDPDSNGGFSDVDVVAGVDYVFKRAAQLGKPAVVNLSLGGNFGSLDGTSLYEETISNLTGEGKIIVAAAGNEGFDFIHAGGTTQANTVNETLLVGLRPDLLFANLWYSPGAISRVAIGVYTIEGGTLTYQGNTDVLDVGNISGVDGDGNYSPIPITFNGTTYGHLTIDALTTQDPRNGDGNVFFYLTNNGDETVDLSKVVWTVLYTGPTAGRADLWTIHGEFFSRKLGIEGSNEIPGDTEYTTGVPSTAKKVISVGSYVTKNSWTDIDGGQYSWLNPNPDHDPESEQVVPELGQRSYFSSQGPTRDGRTAPDIAAPGELIFSPLSSHLTEGTGYQRPLVLQGGRYLGMQGTSMASPHVTGVVALMLQADPTLDYDRTVQILQQTARADGLTGTTPNNRFGAGRIDAHAAVKMAAGGGGGGGTAVANVNVQQLALSVRPDAQVTQSFTLRNTGDATLTYAITATTPGKTDGIAAGTLSGLTVADAPARGLPSGEAGAKTTGKLPTAAPGPKRIAAAPLDTAGDDVLLLDDGNNAADTFIGFSDGSDLYWMNEFVLGNTPFRLERIHVFMSSEDAPTNTIWVGVYDEAGETLVSGTVTKETAPQGQWIEIQLQNPIDFAAGQMFYLEIGASEALTLPDPEGFYPAGVDQAAGVKNQSYYYDTDAEQYQNLNTVGGFENAAFLIRAVGTAGGGGGGQNQPPQVQASISTDAAAVGQSISFDASASSDPDGQIVSFLWNFGDGATSTQATTTHAYTAAGVYAVTVTVTDDDGATAQVSRQITVTGGGGTPALTVNPSNGTIAPGASQTIEVGFNAQGIAEGFYQAQLSITSNGGSITLPVQISIDRAVAREEEGELPRHVELSQNFPNPFNPETVIRFDLPAAASVTLSVYDVLGRRVRELTAGQRPAGVHEVRWDGRDGAGTQLPSGLYLYRLDVAGAPDLGATSLVRTMMLLK